MNNFNQRQQQLMVVKDFIEWTATIISYTRISQDWLMQQKATSVDWYLKDIEQMFYYMEIENSGLL